MVDESHPKSDNESDRSRPERRHSPSHDRRQDIEPSQRLSDAEREAVVAQLSEGLGEGRLDFVEFNTRLDAAYAARTHGEIAHLTDDLPAPNRRSSSSPTIRHRRRLRRYRSYLGVNVILWSVWSAQELTGSGAHDLWPLWFTIPYGAWLVVRSL